MQITRINILVLKLLLIISTSIFLLTSCANSSVSPTGGPKDETPPVLLALLPEYQAKNFKGQEIVFTFNEYLQIRDQNKNFSVSPPPEKKPTLTLKRKSLIVKFPEPLKDSTTYFLNFGSSITDLNEGNALTDFDFTFSTGENLDTLVFVGHIVDALSLEPIKEAQIFLYEKNYDSIPLKEHPSALSKTDESGVFIIKGLKDVKYKLVVVTDLNSNYRYDAANEQIGFSDSLIKPYFLGRQDSVSFESLPIFNLFKETTKRQLITDYKRPEERLVQMIFNAPNVIINNIDFEGIAQKDILLEPSENRDTLRYWLLSDKLNDTVNVTVNYMKTDSLNMLSPDTTTYKFYVEKKAVPQKPKRGKDKDEDEEEDEQILDLTFSKSAKYVLEHDMRIFSKSPIKKINEANIKVERIEKVEPKALKKGETESDEKQETEVRKSVKFTLEKDTTIHRAYILKADWKEKEKYEITFMPASFIDIYNLANDTIIEKIEMPDIETFGKLNFNIVNGKSDCQYIIQIIKDKKIVEQKIIKGNGECLFPYLTPDKYKVKIIEDRNSNSKWDTGEYLEKRQAEKVAFLLINEEDVVEIKAFWDISKDIDVQKIFN